LVKKPAGKLQAFVVSQLSAKVYQGIALG